MLGYPIGHDSLFVETAFEDPIPPFFIRSAGQLNEVLC